MNMEHISERATTHDEVLRLAEAYRLFAATDRYVVGSRSWQMDPRGDPAWACQAKLQLEDISRAENGFTELVMGDRYQLGEPFDIEVNERGFVVWSATSLLIAHRTTLNQASPQLLAPRPGNTPYGVAAEPTLGQVAHHEPFAQPNKAFADAIEAGAPIVGLLEFSEFPVTGHGWGPVEIDVRFPPVTLHLW